MVPSCGLGVGRTIAAAIEQNHDELGIVWPVPLAPFACLVSVLQRDADVVKAADDLYEKLKAAGVDVFYDDRDERPGVKFKDADLIGFPVRVVVGGKALAKGVVEVNGDERADRLENTADPSESARAGVSGSGRGPQQKPQRQ